MGSVQVTWFSVSGALVQAISAPNLTASAMLPDVGFTGSVILWAACFWLGIVVSVSVQLICANVYSPRGRAQGGLTGSTQVSLAQPNCTAGLGGAKLLLYTDLGLMLLAVVVFVASVINPLVSDVAER